MNGTMPEHVCSRCLAPLTHRERLFDSLLCVACEKALTAYDGPLPNPNLAFAGQPAPDPPCKTGQTGIWVPRPQVR